MDINDFKNTSYLANVDLKDLIAIFKKCGYRLDEHVEEPCVITANNRTKKVNVTLYCVDIVNDITPPKKALWGYGWLPLDTLDGAFISTVFYVNDYAIKNMRPRDGERDEVKLRFLQKYFKEFMVNKFGQEYLVKYNKYHAKLNKNKDDNQK